LPTTLQTSHTSATFFVLDGWGEIVSVKGYVFTELEKISHAFFSKIKIAFINYHLKERKIT